MKRLRLMVRIRTGDYAMSGAERVSFTLGALLLACVSTDNPR